MVAPDSSPPELSGLFSLVGAWRGAYELILEPGRPNPPTHTSAEVEGIADGKLVTLYYDWSLEEPAYDEGEQDGMLLIGVNPMARSTEYRGTPMTRPGQLPPVELPPLTWMTSTQEAVPDEIVEIAWCDSFHMDSRIMQLRGVFTTDGGFSAHGEYTAPDGVPWGWHIDVAVDGPDAFTLAMYNVTPDGEEQLAVRAVYERDDPVDVAPDA